MSAFVDAYFSFNLSLGRKQDGHNFFRANDVQNGFALAQVGLSAVYEADPVGGTIYLRFGPQAPRYAGNDQYFGLEYVRQAVVTWKPHEKLTLDFGKWDAFMGAEAIDSQENFTYTRGFVHWLAQPRFHTGLRAAYQPAPQFGLTAFGATGVDRTIDNNIGKTFGLQARITPSKTFFANIGYVVGPEQDDEVLVFFNPGSSSEQRVNESANKRLSHVADLVVSYRPNDRLSLLLNADFGTEERLIKASSDETEHVKWFGLALAGQYRYTDALAAAARFEYYKDLNGYTTGFRTKVAGNSEDPEVDLFSGTLTVEVTPSRHLSIKLESRIDYASHNIFLHGVGFGQTTYPPGYSARTSIQPTITLGVVAKTN